jgi:hypothetical protein
VAKSTTSRATTVASLIDEAWELARAGKRSASRPLLDALKHAVRIRDLDAIAAVRAAANQMRYLSPELAQPAFSEILEFADHWQSVLEAEGLRAGDPRRLEIRLESLLLLLRRSPDDAMPAGDALTAFAVTGRNGDEAFDLRGPYLQWCHLLEHAYGRAYRIYSELTRTPLAAVRLQLERQTKTVAVELITAGAQVRGLAHDAVPLIAFCLLHRELPIGMDTDDSPVSQDRMNDAVISIADDIAAMPEASRGAFIDLYRLALLLGVAQRYAEELSLTKLSTSF